MKTLFVLTTMVSLTSPLLAGDSKDYPNVAEWKLKDTGYHTGDMVEYKSNIFRAAYWAGKEPGSDPGWSLYDELYNETSHSGTQAAKMGKASSRHSIKPPAILPHAPHYRCRALAKQPGTPSPSNRSSRAISPPRPDSRKIL